MTKKSNMQEGKNERNRRYDKKKNGGKNEKVE